MQLFALALCAVCDFVPVPIPVSIGAIFLTALIVAVSYKLKWHQCIFVSMFSLALFVAADVIVNMMTAMFAIPFHTALTGFPFFVGSILAKFAVYCIAYIIKVSGHRLFDKGFGVKWLLLVVLPLAIVLACIFAYENCRGGQAQQGDLTMLLTLVLLVSGNIFVFYFIDDMYDVILNKEELEVAQDLIRQQEKQYADLYADDREIRKLRHNYKNFLLGALAEIEQGHTEGVKKAFEEELKILSPSLVCSGNSTFDAFLTYKISDAQKNGIKFDFSFQNMKAVDFSKLDLAILLGNAIDNAIEATFAVENEQEKSIGFSAMVSHAQLIVSIINPTDRKTEVHSLSTRKKDRRDHGFGLITMKQIAKKYGGEVILNASEGKFETIIYLLLDSQTSEQGQKSAE